MPQRSVNRGKKILDAGARQAAPGSFVRLTRGYTHYEECGRRGARSVVLVHGFSVPYVIWGPTVQALQSAGLHSIRYDHYGRGFSDRPNIAYNMSLYVEQLHELMDALGCQEVDLVGLSMGGPIAAAVAVARPDRVRRIVLIDPSGVRPAAPGAIRGIAGLPGVRGALIAAIGSAFVLERLATSFYGPAPVRALRQQYQQQMEYGGFGRAVVSAIHHGMLGTFASTYALLGRSQKEILLIWGEDDAAIPFDQSRDLLQLLPQAEFLPVPQSGHVPHLEKPDVVHPRLLAFLN